LTALVTQYGLLGLAFAVLLSLTLWFFTRGGKAIEKKIDKGFEQAIDDVEAQDEFSRATRAYLDAVCKEYSRFSFRGLEKLGIVKVPEFDKAYISLRVTPEADHLEAKMSRRGKVDVAEELSEGAVLHGVGAVGLVEAIKQTRKLAIEGAAGSGKSTLVQWAGLAAARWKLGQRGFSVEQESFAQALGKPLLPLRVILREFNDYCKKKNRARTSTALVEFIAYSFGEHHHSVKLPADFFLKHFQEGCLLLFDGVDEIDPEYRKDIRQAIEELASNYVSAPNCYVITSRPTREREIAQVPGFRLCQVEPLTVEQRDALIRYWYDAVHPELPDEAARSTAELQQDINRSHPRVRDLARTPLMVAIFTVVHYNKQGRLPDQRAEFYDLAVNLLLTEPHHHLGGSASAVWESWGSMTRLERIAHIAFVLHTLQRDALDEGELLDHIVDDFKDEPNPKERAMLFVREAATRSGILEDHGGYGFFTHRTFREFLAGRYLAEQLEQDWKAELAAHLSDDQWEEVMRLAAGFLAHNNRSRADRFIRALLSLGVAPEEKCLALTRAALALSDFPTDRVDVQTRTQLQTEMLDFLTAPKPTVSPSLRRTLGLALSALGDPRLTQPIWERNNYFITIPSGTFQMGTTDDEAKRLKEQGAEAYSDELYPHNVFVSAFGMGKYPVTNADYRAFLNATQENYADWFSEFGKRWVEDTLDPELSFLGNDEETKKQYRQHLQSRPKDKRRQPYYWDDPQWNADNVPVVGVSWFESEAYCNWLTAKLREAQVITSEQKIHLPTEAQWEKSARAQPSNVQHPTSRLWSWGDEWDENKCNALGKLGGTTPVGMYPDGASDYGVMDLMGNVWEWCADWYDEKIYQSRQGQEVRDPQGALQGSARVVRGGSWVDYQGYCRAAYRRRLSPLGFNYNIGFRLALSPIKLLDS